MFGHEVRLPVDVVQGRLTEATDQPRTFDEFVDTLHDRMQRAFDTTRTHLKQAACRRKGRYDIGVREQVFQTGQWVWYYYPRRRKGLTPKWQNWYTGPYLVIRLVDSHNVVIQKTRRSRPIVTHRDKLKACLDPEAHGTNWLAVRPTTLATSGMNRILATRTRIRRIVDGNISRNKTKFRRSKM